MRGPERQIEGACVLLVEYEQRTRTTQNEARQLYSIQNVIEVASMMREEEAIDLNLALVMTTDEESVGDIDGPTCTAL